MEGNEGGFLCFPLKEGHLHILVTPVYLYHVRDRMIWLRRGMRLICRKDTVEDLSHFLYRAVHTPESGPGLAHTH